MAYTIFVLSIALSAIVFGIAFLRPTLKNWSNSGIDQRSRRAKLKNRLKKDRYYVVIE
jgi:molybdopterin biosynthesis enzyme